MFVQIIYILKININLENSTIQNIGLLFPKYRKNVVVLNALLSWNYIYSDLNALHFNNHILNKII